MGKDPTGRIRCGPSRGGRCDAKRDELKFINKNISLERRKNKWIFVLGTSVRFFFIKSFILGNSIISHKSSVSINGSWLVKIVVGKGNVFTRYVI